MPTADRLPTPLRRASPGVVAATVCVLVAIVLLAAWGVRPMELARYAAYWVGVVALPGVLVWRVLGPRLRYGVEDLAVGASLGYAAEVVGRIAFTAAGLPPVAGALAPSALSVLALAVPSIRRRAARPWVALPAAVSWGYAAIALVTSVWFAFGYFARQPVSWTGRGGPENDLLFALALAGEATHRWPLEFPWVQGEPLLYHWFFAEHLASATQLTGVPLPTLVLRLDLLPAMALVLLGTGALATRLARRSWVGPLAGGLLLVVQDASALPWSKLLAQPTADLMGVPYDVSFWWSTSGAFAAVVFTPLAVLLVDVVRGAARRRTWWLLVPLLGVGAGAKASVLPVVLAGTAWVVLSQWWVTRRLNRPALTALVAAGVVFAASWATIYGGQSQSLVLGPFRYVLTTALGSLLLGDTVPGRSALVLVLALIACLATLLVPVAGLGLLLSDRRARTDPAAQLALGGLILGVAGVVLLYHQGQSNLYFLRTALPLLTAAAAWGVSTRVASGVPVKALRPAAVAFAAGLVVMAVLALRDWAVFGPGQGALSRFGQVLIPWAVLAVLALAAAAYLRRSPGRRAVLGLLLVLFLAGAGAVRVPGQAVGWVASHPVGWVDQQANPSQQIDADGVRAARWIASHSGPDDVVVTNALCSNGSSAEVGVCVNRTFWVAAYTERRTVVSGWGYTATANRLATETGAVNNWEVPFWDRARWDAVRSFLADPSTTGADQLAQRGVHWVLAVPGYDPVGDRMGDVADPVFRAGGATVYRLRAPQPPSS
ncbi:hypothetical protein [Pedococcus dokdonensis]|nr:hypothetical protein [Pedococcus dokdonensis]